MLNKLADFIIKISHEIIYKSLLSVVEVLLDSFQPILTVAQSLSEILIGKSDKEKVKIIKTRNKYSLLILYIILSLVEILILSNIFLGRILFIPISIFIPVTLIITIFHVSFIYFLIKNKEHNSLIKSIVIIQLLLVFPFLLAYWVVSINGATFYLNTLTADQWISIYNTAIIYISGCILGTAVMFKPYKKEELINEEKQEKR